MKRLLLDTNAYGMLLIDKDSDLLKASINGSSFLFYGNEVIRRELKRAPRRSAQYEKNLRMDLIRLFDELVRNNIVNVTKEMESLADKYYLVYKEVGGQLSRRKFWNDLVIIACAALRLMDVVVSDDRSTMLNKYAIKAYEIVNKLQNMRTPNFISYDEFKEKLIKRWKPL